MSSQIYCDTFLSPWAHQGRLKREDLGALSDAGLKEFLDRVSAEKLLQGRFLTFKGRPRILKVCNAEQARAVLSTCIRINEDQIFETSIVKVDYEALHIMNEPDRLPVFIEAVRKSRDIFFDRINTSYLLYCPGLPSHIKEVVGIENRLYVTKFLCMSDEKRKSIAAECDAALDALLQSVQKA